MAKIITSHKTYLAKEDEVKQRWHLIDATDKILGRLAVQIANIIRGKHRPTYTPHMDTGDFVVVINAEKIKLTGKKPDQKVYKRYSGFHDGQNLVPFKTVMAKNPERVIYLAVKRMLPSTRLSDYLLRKLHIYAGDQHPHQGQKPELLKVEPQRNPATYSGAELK
ncbi:MAG: 50S ribosomal protein L13 [Planctomycetes bacterium]|nr:50S ribosomal protein L13 [Planctomycetota bacterium]